MCRCCQAGFFGRLAPSHFARSVSEEDVKWIADFRDPWTNIDFYQELMLTSWADKRHRALEREVLTTADKVLTIGYTMSHEMESRNGKENL